MNCAWHGLLLSIGLAVSPGASAQGDPPPGIAPTVGDLQFDGCVAHTPEELAAGLNVNQEYRMAVATAPPARRTRVIERLLTAGLLRAGHPDAQVIARLGRNNAIAVGVYEGPRYLCGQLVITGALEQVSAGALRALLTPPEDALRRALKAQEREAYTKPPPGMMPAGFEWKRSAPSESRFSAAETNSVALAAVLNLWTPGKPAPFDPWAALHWTAAVSNAFAELHHLFPLFNLELVRHQDAGRADLVLNVTDEGPACTIGRVIVDGAIRNRPDDIIAASGLQPGMRLTRAILSEAKARLRETARLTSMRIVPSRPATNGGSIVTIQVTELPGMPPLTEDLSAFAQESLRLRGWLESFPTGSDELSVELSGTHGPANIPWSFNLAMAPTQGVHVAVRGFRGQVALEPMMAMALADGSRAVYSPSRRCKYEIPRSEASLVLFMDVEEVYKSWSPPETGGTLTIGAFAGTASELPLQVSIQCSPAAFASLGYRTDIQTRTAGGDRILDLDGLNVRFDSATGKLRGVQGEDEGCVCDVCVDPGALARAVQGTRGQSAGWSNLYDPSKPISSFVAFIGPEMLRGIPLSSNVIARLTPQQWESAQRGIGRLTEALRDADVDALFSRGATAGTSGPRLSIPYEASTLPTGAVGLPAQAVLWLLSGPVRLAPEGSWVHALLVSQAFGLCRQPQAMALTLDRLVRSPRSGPLALHSCATLARGLSPDTARNILTLALTRLSRAEFIGDLEPLLDDNALCGRVLGTLVAAAATLTDDEADALSALLPGPREESLRSLLRDLSAGGPGEAKERYVASLGRDWNEGGGCVRFERRLRGARDRINTGCLGIPGPCDVARAAPGVIDLGGVYNASLTNVFGSSEQASNCIQVLSATLQRVGDCDFDVRGLVLTAPPSQQRRMPMEVRGIALGRACRRLHFLHAVLGPGALENERQVVQYRIAYTDRRRDVVDVLVGRDIANARVADDDTAKRPAVAWEVADPQGGTAGGRVRFYVQTWDNPRPDVPIASIDMANWHTRAMPFLVALSASP